MPNLLKNLKKIQIAKVRKPKYCKFKLNPQNVMKIFNAIFYMGWGISHGNYFISWIYVNGSQTYMCRVECQQAQCPHM